MKRYEKLNTTYYKRQLDLRVEVVRRFMEYLKQEEKKESIESEMIAKGIVNEIFDSSLSHDLYRIEKIIKSA
jgi:hypothetical protein